MSHTINFKSGGAVIPAEMFDATGTPNGGVVVIAYGSDGMTDDLNGPWATMIREYADELSRKGFATIIPYYFAKTGTEPGISALEQIPIHVDAWQATVGDAITHAKTLPGVVASRIGLLGFSLGGHICLRLRAQTRVLVAFFAPVLQGLGSAVLTTLHAQVHHGLADNTVPSADAKRIDGLLRGEGATSELFLYDGAGHGFPGTTQKTQLRAATQKNALYPLSHVTCDTGAPAAGCSGFVVFETWADCIGAGPKQTRWGARPVNAPKFRPPAPVFRVLTPSRTRCSVGIFSQVNRSVVAPATASFHL